MYHRRLLSEMWWTDTEYGKVMRTQRLGGSVSQGRKRFIRPTWLVTRTRSWRRYGWRRSPSRSLDGSGGRFAPTTASGCGSPSSGPSSGSGSSGGGEVATASGGRDANSPACSGGGTRAGGIGNFTQIVTLRAAGTGATASTGILPA